MRQLYKIKSWLLFITLNMMCFSAFAAPKSDLWSYWNQSNPQNTQTIDHHPWQDILNQYLLVNGENTLFSYNKVTSSDSKKLNQYIQSLAQKDPRILNKREQYAYWVNLYNAITVQIILENYPVSSITKIGGIFSFGPWDEKRLTITNQKVSLNDIEHRILRPIWQDPRTHYAVNCASLGCPNLQPKAFTSSNSEQLLSKAESSFIQSSKGVNIQGETVILSSIYDWFADDFGGKEKVWKYLQGKKPELKNKRLKITYEYNWDLNESK